MDSTSLHPKRGHDEIIDPEIEDSNCRDAKRLRSTPLLPRRQIFIPNRPVLGSRAIGSPRRRQLFSRIANVEENDENEDKENLEPAGRNIMEPDHEKPAIRVALGELSIRVAQQDDENTQGSSQESDESEDEEYSDGDEGDEVEGGYEQLVVPVEDEDEILEDEAPNVEDEDVMSDDDFENADW